MNPAFAEAPTGTDSQRSRGGSAPSSVPACPSRHGERGRQSLSRAGSATNWSAKRYGEGRSTLRGGGLNRVPFQGRVPPFLCPPSVSHGLRPRSRTQGRRHLRRTQGRHHLCHTPRGPAPPTPTLHFASTYVRLSRGRVSPLLGVFPSRAPVSLPLSPSLIALYGRAPRARACLPRSMRPARLCTNGRRGAQGTAVRAKGGRRGRRRC